MSEMEKEQANNQPGDNTPETPNEPGYQPPQAPLESTDGDGPAPAQLGAAARLIGVITKPGITFQDFRNKNGASWLLPALLLIVFASASTYAFILRVDKDEYVAVAMEMVPQMAINALSQQMGPEEVYDMLATQIKAGIPMAGVQVGINMVVISIISTLLIWLIGKLVGSKAKFGQVLTVYMFAFGAPLVIKEVLGLILNLIRDPNSMVFEGMMHQFVASNPAVIIGVDSLGLRGFAILANLDVFLVWTLFLQIVGIAAVGRMSKGRAAVPVIATYALFLTCSLGAMLIFGMGS